MKLNPLHSLLIFRCGFVVAIVFTTFMALIDPKELPDLNIWDKLQHAAVFAFLSFLLDQSFPQYHYRRILHPAQMIFLLAYGIGIEWLQSYTPYREASSLDVVADVVGITLYGLFYFKRHSGKNIG